MRHNFPRAAFFRKGVEIFRPNLNRTTDFHNFVELIGNNTRLSLLHHVAGSESVWTNRERREKIHARCEDRLFSRSFYNCRAPVRLCVWFDCMTTLRGRHGARRFFPTNPLCASSLVCVHVSLLEVASRFSCVPSTTDCRPTLTKTLVSKRRARQHSHQLKIMKNHIFLVFRNLSPLSLLPIIPSPSHFSGRPMDPILFDVARRHQQAVTLIARKNLKRFRS